MELIAHEAAAQHLRHEVPIHRAQADRMRVKSHAMKCTDLAGLGIMPLKPRHA